MAKKPERIICGDLMNRDDAQKLAKWKRIVCDKDPGHEGNHEGRNRFARFEWWNKEKNPQHETTRSVR